MEQESEAVWGEPDCTAWTRTESHWTCRPLDPSTSSTLAPVERSCFCLSFIGLVTEHSCLSSPLILILRNGSHFPATDHSSRTSIPSAITLSGCFHAPMAVANAAHFFCPRRFWAQATPTSMVYPCSILPRPLSPIPEEVSRCPDLLSRSLPHGPHTTLLQCCVG
jgi:hypothetical protein